MKLTKFRIYNYKSIRDSGLCYILDRLTIFAGKNESGKTAILEALKDFNKDQNISAETFPINQENAKPKIECHFVLEKHDLGDIKDEYKKLARSFLDSKIDLSITKNYDNTYIFDENFNELFLKFFPLDDLNANEVDMESLRENENYLNIQSFILKNIPNFIYFNDFSDLLPTEIKQSEAQTNIAVINFAKVANFDFSEVISTPSSVDRKNLLSRKSATLTGNFSKFYNQDSLELICDCDGNNFLFYVKEKGKPELYPLKSRSKGLQWFISFYLNINAQKKENNILLIDEPGLYLHARAQNDVLIFIEDKSKELPIIFSTHSPYLINPHKLNLIKLITKTDDFGTIIENKIHRNADIDTLTPIYTAIGYQVASDNPFVKEKNIIVEGISDYYYLSAINSLLESGKQLANDIAIIPATGASKICLLASYLIGWDLDFICIFDNDEEGKKSQKKLLQELGSDIKTLFISIQSGYEIEDLFSLNDFNNLVIEQSEIKNDQENLNSKFIKNNKIDKVITAKLFYDNIKDNQDKLSEQTKDNFLKLNIEIKKLFQ